MKCLILLAVFLWPIAVQAADADCTYDMARESSKCREQLEEETLARYPDVFQKDEDSYSLIINIKHGAPVKLVGKKPTDSESESTVVVYTILGVLDPLRYAVVDKGFYEGDTMYLVNLDTGSKYEIEGTPLVSPDHTRILVASLDIDANYSRNLLDVYRVDGEKLVKEIHLDGEADRDAMWGPDHVAWVGNALITFDMTTHGENGEYAYVPRRLVLKKGRWVVEVPPG